MSYPLSVCSERDGSQKLLARCLYREVTKGWTVQWQSNKWILLHKWIDIFTQLCSAVSWACWNSTWRGFKNGEALFVCAIRIWRLLKSLFNVDPVIDWKLSSIGNQKIGWVMTEVCVDAVVSSLVLVLKLPYHWHLRAVPVKISMENETILVDHLR